MFTNAHADLTRDGPVATLTIARSGKLNLLSTPVITALREALQKTEEAPNLRVLVLRGESDRAFVGGADINEMARLDEPGAAIFIDGLRGLCEDVRTLSVPVIARLPSWTLGGGLELAMACDLRIAARSAMFGMPEVHVGIPSIIHAALLPRLVGAGTASWMLLTGEPIDADQAKHSGLVDRVVEDGELDLEVGRVASLIASFGPSVVRQQKRLLREWQEEPLAVSIRNGVKEFASSFRTGEPQSYLGEFVRRKRERHPPSD